MSLYVEGKIILVLKETPSVRYLLIYLCVFNLDLRAVQAVRSILMGES